VDGVSELNDRALRLVRAIRAVKPARAVLQKLQRFRHPPLGLLALREAETEFAERGAGMRDFPCGDLDDSPVVAGDSDAVGQILECHDAAILDEDAFPGNTVSQMLPESLAHPGVVAGEADRDAILAPETGAGMVTVMDILHGLA